MAYAASTDEQTFVLRHIAQIGALAGAEPFPDFSDDMVDPILEAAAALATGAFAPLARIGDTVGARWRDGTVTMPDGYRAAYRAFAGNGWAGLGGPRDYGGQALPLCLTTAAMENFGTANVGFPLVSTLTHGAVEMIAAHGDAQQKRRWLPNLVSGKWAGTMNITEPQAGSDVGALRTSARPIGGGTYKIKGQKIFITYGEHDLTENIVHLVLARTPDAPAGSKGVSLFIVPKYRLDGSGAPTLANGVRCVSIEHKLGIHVSPTCVMAYGDNDDCIGELLGEACGGLKAMFTMINSARIAVGNQGVQVAERALQRALAYARERVQSPRADGSSAGAPVPIIAHPDVRRMLLRMKALTQGTRALLYYAAGQADRAHMGDAAAESRLHLMTPLVKSYGSNVACETASLGIQVHGGMGFIEETGAAQHYRDARILPIYEGTNGIQAADFVGRKLKADGGATFGTLLEEIRADCGGIKTMRALEGAVGRTAHWMLDGAGINDRLAGSYAFMTMTSVLAAGWLMARQGRSAAQQAQTMGETPFLRAKQIAVRYYLEHLVPEALGLEAQAMAGAQILYALSDEELTA
jgi:alkylation response protein AidB-like acyl-CoA dehydrogenase